MSQYQQPEFQDQYAGAGEIPPRTSGLAIGALICSLIFCCPVTTILGILLGLIAMVTIGRDPLKKGRGLAILAILLGVIFTIGQGGAYWWFQDKFWTPMRDGPAPALQAGFDGDTQAMRDAMYLPTTSPSDQQVNDFIDELRSRYGALVDVTLDQQRMNQQGQQPQVGQEQMVLPYLYTFENATLGGEALFVFADRQTGDFVLKPQWFTIEDPDRGDMTFPPGADTSAGQTGSGGPPDDGDGDGDTGDDSAAGANGPTNGDANADAQEGGG